MAHASQGTLEPLPPRTVTDRAQAAQRILLRNALIIILIFIAIGFALVNGNFATPSNFRTILFQASPLALIAFGQTFEILTAGIDLSVGSIIGMSGVIGALAMVHGVPFIISLLIGVASGLIVGVVNGLLVAYASITPFVATLGTLSIALSIAYILSSGQPVSPPSTSLTDFGTNTFLSLPIPVWITFAILIILWLILTRTQYGIHIYAVGGNSVAAQISGIKVKRILLSVYAIAGLLAGLAGIIFAAQVSSGIATNGNGDELIAIAAPVIGGVSLFGGRGSIWGAALGIILIEMLTNGLNVLGVSPFYQGLVQGSLIIIAIFLDGLYLRIYGDS